MLRIINLLDEISEVCFTDDERSILEFDVNSRKMTIAKQLKIYYRSACYNKDKEDLFDEIILIKEQNKDILEQIKRYKSIIDVVTNPYAYNLRKTAITDREEGKGTASSHDNTSSDETKNKQDTVNNEYDNSQRLSRSRSAKSETNEVQDLADVWDEHQLKIPQYTKKDIIEGGDFASSSVIQTDVAASSTTLSEGEEKKLTPLEYQNFDVEETLDGDFSNNHTNNTSATKSLSKQKSDGTSTSISHSKTAKKVTSDEYAIGDNVLKVAEINLPRFRDKFWLRFSGIFQYERNY